MAALAADRAVPTNISGLDQLPSGGVRNYGVVASDIVYQGSFVNLGSGYIRPCSVGAAQVVGIALHKADNAAGAAGAKSVQVWTGGLFQHALAAAAVTDIQAAGKLVYADNANSNGDHVLTFMSTANSLVGRVVDVPAAGQVVVRMLWPQSS